MGQLSERAFRKKQAGILAQQLLSVDKERAASAKVKEALELAHRVLLEEPKTVTPCKFLLEFSPFSAQTERAHCSECGEASIGHNERWRFCPLCGSQIEHFEREENPDARLLNERVKSALEEIHVNG